MKCMNDASRHHNPEMLLNLLLEAFFPPSEPIYAHQHTITVIVANHHPKTMHLSFSLFLAGASLSLIQAQPNAGAIPPLLPVR